jgi:zinc D-Ala-D-Ala dipeptidase
VRSRKPIPREPLAVLNRIVIRENGEPLVEVTDGRHGIRVRPDRRIWLRKTVAEMVHRAQAGLPGGLHLYLLEGYRSLDRQRAMYEYWRGVWSAEHPDWPPNILTRYANRFIAPPDTKSPPGHSTGGAIDLSMVDDEGRELDFISPHGLKIGNAPTWWSDVSPEARANRRTLFEAMEAQGLKNYPQEWWHYSYGDSGWAVRQGRKTCSYGAVAAPPGYEAPEV